MSRERRSHWITAIYGDDLTDNILENERVCGRHFVSGKAAKGWDRFNVDSVPTLFRAVYEISTVGPKNLEKAADKSLRVRDLEEIKKSHIQEERREEELEGNRGPTCKLSDGNHIATISYK